MILQGKQKWYHRYKFARQQVYIIIHIVIFIYVLCAVSYCDNQTYLIHMHGCIIVIITVSILFTVQFVYNYTHTDSDILISIAATCNSSCNKIIANIGYVRIHTYLASFPGRVFAFISDRRTTRTPPGNEGKSIDSGHDVIPSFYNTYLINIFMQERHLH